MRFLTGTPRSSTGHVGIAFDEDGIRMLQVRDHRDGLRVTGAGWVPGAQGEGDQSADAIRSAFINGGFTGRRCVVCLPRSEVWTQLTRFPEMPQSELRAAAIWEASDRFGMARDQLQCDWLPLGSSEKGRQEVLLVAASTDRLGARLQAILDAGLRPVAVDTDFGGLARLFSRRYRRDADQQSSRVVLDVGPSGSTLLMLSGHRTTFCKSLAIGGRHFDAAVAEHLDLDHEAARELRWARLEGETTLDATTDAALTAATRSVVSELARDAMLCLRHYSVSIRGTRPDYLVMSGCHAAEPGLADAVAQACRLTVRADDQSGTLQSLASDIRAQTAGCCGPISGWASVAGLSLREKSSRRSGQRVAA